MILHSISVISAYVRGKVISFKLDDSNVTHEEKKAAAKEAQAYFKLAETYAKEFKFYYKITD